MKQSPDIEVNSGRIKPFLRWAGGKLWLSKRLKQIFGDIVFERYHEPFLGGGSVFFSLHQPTQSFLSDSNHALIETYQCLKKDPHKIIHLLKGLSNDENSYYKIRALMSRDAFERAAHFIYLNQTSYNGIYRVNLKGFYNVPFGHRQKKFLDESVLLDASVALQNSSIFVSDFESTKNNMRKGDLVFIDPPYTVSHNTNGFIKYNKALFSLEDQHRLANYIDELRGFGIKYIMTNAAHETIKTIFVNGDQVVQVERASLVGGKKARRGKVSELIFTNLDVTYEASQQRHF